MALDNIPIKDGVNDTQLLNVVKGAANTDLSWLHTSRDLVVAVSQGLLPGWDLFRKFGYNPTITVASDPEDVILQGGTLTLDAWGTAPIVSISSTSASDAGKSLIIEGLDINGDSVRYLQTLGSARTALNTPLWRFHRAFLIGSTPLVGNIYIYTGTGTVPGLGDPEVRGYLEPEDNQTQQCVYTVPDGKVFMLFDSKSGMVYTSGAFSGDEYVIEKFQTQAYNGLWTTKQYFSVNSRGTSAWDQQVENFPLVPGRTAMKLLIWEVSAALGVWGEFTGFVIDEDQITDARLSAIGQPGYPPAF